MNLPSLKLLLFITLIILHHQFHIKLANKKHHLFIPQKTFTLLFQNLNISTPKNKLKPITRFKKQFNFTPIDQSTHNCNWNPDMQDITQQYPKMVKDTVRFNRPLCTPSKCKTITQSRDEAVCKALTFPHNPGTDNIYYVNTRRLQKNPIQSNKQDFLNQFTFAVLPISGKEMTDDYEPQIFSVIVPIDKEGLSYTMSHCAFDFSKGILEDMLNESQQNCDYNVVGGSVKLTYHKNPKNVRAEDSDDDIYKTIETKMRYQSK